MENQNLCEAVQNIPTGAAERHWTLHTYYRCAGGSHWHAKLKLSESPLYLELHWRRDRFGSVRRLGVFRLDLNGLLRDGFIRSEKSGENDPCVRLRVFRADDGIFYVQTKQRGPKRFLADDSLIPKETQQQPADLPEPPMRCEAQVSRIIRDTQLARDLKSLYGFACQVCGLRIEPSPLSFYIEVHHVRPLGGSHAGLDIQANMLVLCPNHHAMFDYGIPHFLSPQRIEIAGVTHDLIIKHELSPESIAYHNTKIKIVCEVTA
jgi:5-methylcytosine-specific restriction endonuclease McrA